MKVPKVGDIYLGPLGDICWKVTKVLNEELFLADFYSIGTEGWYNWEPHDCEYWVDSFQEDKLITSKLGKLLYGLEDL